MKISKARSIDNAALWLHFSGNMLHIYAAKETPGLLIEAVAGLHKAIGLLHEALHDGNADA